MNIERGLKRLWIVIGVPYVSAWTLVLLACIVRLHNCPGWLFGPEIECYFDMPWEDFENTRDLALVSVILGYLVPLMTWLAGRWVYRGFRS